MNQDLEYQNSWFGNTSNDIGWGNIYTNRI